MSGKVKTLLFVLCLSASSSLFYSHRAEAVKAVQSYIMWSLPATKIGYPVYVYNGKKQVGYIYGSSQQAIIGPYKPSGTTGSYDLFYQSDDGWHSCSVALQNGNIDVDQTTCPGAVINKPKVNGNAKSNVWTIALAAIAWDNSGQPPSAVVNTDYGQRKITFINNTPYQMIQIGEACTTSDNPNNPKCTNTQNLFQIKKGQTAVLKVDDPVQEGNSFPAGLKSASFFLSAYQNSAGQIIETGGYRSGQTAYATKVELTALPVAKNGNYQVPSGYNNFDVSLVDGYNIAVTAYPETTSYCTYTVPPGNSNILGAGQYGPQMVMAKFPTNGSSSALSTACKESSQLPDGYKGTEPAWILTLAAGKDFSGCMSPCTYARVHGSTEQGLMCCSGSTYNTPAKCDQPAGRIGANNSTYVTELGSTSKNMYRYAYDDAIGDFACPPEINFVVVFR
jgi:hypothetical protein